MARAPKEDQTPRFVKFPLKHRSKEPACRFTSRDRFELPDDLENAGIRLDGIVVLDTDPKNMPEGMTLDASNALLRAYGVDLDRHPRVRTGSRVASTSTRATTTRRSGSLRGCCRGST